MTTDSNNSRKVVLHLVPTLATGGGELQLLQNLRHFDTTRYRHIVACIRPPLGLLPGFEQAGFSVECLDPNGRSGFMRRVFKLRRLIKANNVSLIHTTNAEADKLGGVAGFLTRVPVASTLNAVAYSDEWYRRLSGLNIWKLRYMKYTRKFALRLFVRKFNAVSNVMKDSFVGSLGLSPGKIDVIYRGVDTTRFSKRTQPRSSTEPDYPRILNVGRLVGEKGQKDAIDAMPTIRKAFPNATLQIAGEGYLLEALRKQIADLKLEDSVKLLGYQSEVQKLLWDADVFVLPSLSEGCPNALLEAMSVGLPCVASDSEAVVELVAGRGVAMLTPGGDPEMLAQAVVEIARDPDRAAKLGDAASEYVSKNLSIEHAAQELEEFYSRILGNSDRD